MKQIVIAMKGKHFDLPHIDNRPEPLAKRDIAWQRTLRPRLYREDRYHSEKETQVAP